jgi:uncharacterized protein
MAFAHTLRARRQGLTILTTEACNFACVYCHQPHDPVHMGPEVTASIARFVERKAKNLDELAVSWFGGEPLANQRAIVELSQELRRICEGNGIALHGFMSTNGYLLNRPLLVKLLGLGISRYQITFDGPKSTHDGYRLAKNGGATFDRIWGHVTSFRDLDEAFEILLRVHVTPETVADVDGFLGTLRDEFSADSRFKITVANVSHWGGPNDATIPVFGDPTVTLEELSSRISASNACTDENVYCNAADPHHLVIRPNGSVVKCAHSLELEENRIGRLESDGRFVYEAGKIDFWIRGLATGDVEALQCPRNGLERLHPASTLVRRPARN